MDYSFSMKNQQLHNNQILIYFSLTPFLQQLFDMNEDNNEPTTIQYNFIKQYQVSFGQALYLTGELQELGEWNPHKAIRMSCRHDKYWITEVAIPLQVRFQFKYFVAPYNLTSDNISAIVWMEGKNERLCIPNQLKNKFEKENNQLLDIMSFNLRFENNNDKGEYSWQSRGKHCCSLILKHMPDVVGVQQPKSSQVQFVVQRIGHLYHYFGKPRDLREDQHSGVFIRKDKFVERNVGYVWINQQKLPGLVGFGARLPRYFTYLVVQPVCIQKKLFMIVNTHLDHESQQSRINGVRLISEKIQQKVANFGPALRNVFITGDFNSSDEDSIFDSLAINSERIHSIRSILPKEKSDFEETFHGFRPRILSLLGSIVKLSKYITIDHIFARSYDYVPLQLKVLRHQNHIISDHYPIIGYFTTVDSMVK